MKVKIIREEGAVSLVEWITADGYHRTVLPTESITNNRCSVDELNRGMTYGEDWSEVMIFTASPDAIKQELYRAGIWITNDVLGNPDAVRGVLNKVLQDTLESLFRFATGKGVNHG